MAKSLSDIADLATSDVFRLRVWAAVMNAAREIGEGSSNFDEDYWVRRRDLARDVVQYADLHREGFAWLVASSPGLLEHFDDDDIQYTVNAVWDAAAGAGERPAVARSTASAESAEELLVKAQKESW